MKTEKSNSCKHFILEMCWNYFHFTFHLEPTGYVRNDSSTALYILRVLAPLLLMSVLKGKPYVRYTYIN